MKQTAIEWLIDQLENHNGVTRSGFEKCIQQAEEMEKEQIENAYRKGYTESSWGRHSNSEQYYKLTFKSE